MPHAYETSALPWSHNPSPGTYFLIQNQNLSKCGEGDGFEDIQWLDRTATFVFKFLLVFFELLEYSVL